MARDLVFVHGMWSQSSVWDEWLPRFSEQGYRCRAVTLPSHRTGVDESELARLDFEACMQVALDEVATLHRPVIIGHSLGGLIAQRLAALLDPSAVVLINSAAPRAVFPTRPISLPGLARHLRAIFLGREAQRNVVRLSPWESNYLLWNGLSAGQRTKLHEQSVPESARLICELAFGPLGTGKAHHVEPSKIRCPMLALASSGDRIIPREVSRRMATYYGDKLSYREFPERAHWLLAEPGFETRIAEVLRWLAGGVTE